MLRSRSLAVCRKSKHLASSNLTTWADLLVGILAMMPHASVKAVSNAVR